MCGLVISAFVLSLFGALVQRGAAAALGVPARFVLGVGPRLGDREAPPRAFEVRPVMLWSWVPLLEGGARWRRGLVRAVGPLAIVLLPFSIQVVTFKLAGASEDVRSERLVVDRIEPGSPADEAGIAAGDIIVSVAGQPVRSMNDLWSELRDLDGVPTRFELERAGARRELDVTPDDVSGYVGVYVEHRWRRRPIGVGEALEAAVSMDHHALVRLARLLGGDIDGIAGPVGMVREAEAQARREDAADRLERVGMLAGLWTLHAIPWALIAAVSQLVRAVRGRP